MRVVLDTSVMVAAALSRRGASFAIIEMIPLRRFEVCLSISLYMEWNQRGRALNLDIWAF